jgi:hypothetical protein
MIVETVRLQQNLHTTLGGFSLRQLYIVARALGDELTHRELDASLEARALECALLPLARVEQLAIFSADCSERRWDGIVSPLADDGEGV